MACRVINESDSDSDAINSVTFSELLEDIISIHEQTICLQIPRYWMELPRIIEEKIEMTEPYLEEWENLKILFKKMENYFQSHKDNSFETSLKNLFPRLRKAMGSGFKMLFSAELQEGLTNWLTISTPILEDMEDLSVSLLPTTPMSTSTTTARMQDNHVDAIGEKRSRKRKATSLEDAFDALVDEDELESSQYPTGNVSSYISLRKGDGLSHRILMEK